jgi:hypothetical protein
VRAEVDSHPVCDAARASTATRKYNVFRSHEKVTAHCNCYVQPPPHTTEHSNVNAVIADEATGSAAHNVKPDMSWSDGPPNLVEVPTAFLLSCLGLGLG